MKPYATILAFAALASGVACAQSVSVQKIQGDVSVRHGVTEQWTTVAAGDVLRPDDTMRTGVRGSAVLMAPTKGEGRKRITLPSEVIVDVPDIRDLTPEELMLKLTMEKVRGSSYQSKDDVQAPNASVVHGTDKAASTSLKENDPAAGIQEWNGARVLFDNGFYSTCALKGMELFRLYPETVKDFDRRIMVAHSLELAHLRGEALSEYLSIQGMGDLSTSQRATLAQRIGQVKGK